MINGFYMAIGTKGYFYKTETKKRTAGIVNAFIDKLAIKKGLDPAAVDKIKNDKKTTDQIKRYITEAALHEKELSSFKYYIIQGKNFSESFPEADFNRDIIVF